jgi:hypothetical protein
VEISTAETTIFVESMGVRFTLFLLQEMQQTIVNMHNTKSLTLIVLI